MDGMSFIKYSVVKTAMSSKLEMKPTLDSLLIRQKNVVLTGWGSILACPHEKFAMWKNA